MLVLSFLSSVNCANICSYYVKSSSKSTTSFLSIPVFIFVLVRRLWDSTVSKTLHIISEYEEHFALCVCFLLSLPSTDVANNITRYVKKVERTNPETIHSNIHSIS